MSEQHVSQIPSDFSIARILSGSLSQKQEINRQFNPTDHQFQTKISHQSVETNHQQLTQDKNCAADGKFALSGSQKHEFVCDRKKRVEIVQESSQCKSTRETFDKVDDRLDLKLNFEDVKQDEDLREDDDDGFGLLERRLPWLQCTRYSPPKLPRRSAAGKQKKRRLGSHPRIPFTKFQIQVLEEKYRISAYLSRRDVIQLGGILNLPQNRVKIWFQNRRARERKESQSLSTTS